MTKLNYIHNNPLQERLRKANYQRHRFPRRYTRTDIALLARTDELHDSLSGPATKRIMEREWAVYGHSDFGNMIYDATMHGSVRLCSAAIRIDLWLASQEREEV